jgi:hypothetical protein
MLQLLVVAAVVDVRVAGATKNNLRDKKTGSLARISYGEAAIRNSRLGVVSEGREAHRTAGLETGATILGDL